MIENKLNLFENEFNIKAKNDNVYKMIIGKSPYKQKLNQKNLAVSMKIGAYKGINNIAFFVNEWIKVQDSLEMIFNLLFGIDKSIQALGYLRENKITPQDFGKYLEEKHKLVLINRFVNDKSNLNKIISLLKKQECSKQVLFVGNEISQKIKKLEKCEWAKVIHPSGLNLNKDEQLYYETWYQFQIKKTYKSKKFNINNFKITK